MAVSTLRRLVRDRMTHEAEGYLELLSACAPDWELESAARDRIATRALVALRRLDEADQQTAYVRYLQGLAYRAMCRHDEAIPLLRDAADLNPDDTHALLALGWCYKRVGRLRLAIHTLEEALALEPDAAIIHYNLACYWSLAGNAELALEYLATSIQIEPQYRELAASEDDFNPIRRLRAFRELTQVIV